MAYTNTMRLVGLNSGLDTESMVTQLMNAESMKLNRFKKKATALTWKQEAYRGVHSNLKSFQSTFLDILSPSSITASATFNKFSSKVKTSSGADSSAVKASVSSSSSAGTYKVKVQQLAQTDVYQSASKISGIQGAPTFNVSNVKAGDKYTVTLDGVSRAIEFKEGDEFVVGNERRKITFTGGTLGYTVGEGENLPVIPATNEDFVKALNYKLEATFGKETVKVRVGEADVEKTSAKIFATLTANPSPSTDGKLSINTSPLSTHTASIQDASARDDGSSPLAAIGLASGSSTAMNTSDTLEKLFGFSGSQTVTINTMQFNITANTTLKEFMDKVNNSSAGVTLSYSASAQTFKMESNETGSAKAISMSDGFLKDQLGLTNNSQKAQDSIVTIDGETFIRETNSYSEFGVNWSFTEETGNETLTVTIGRDTDATYNSIKSFVDAYNTLIDTLKGITDTRRPKSNGSYFEPLLDEEKEGMTESQISKWEEQAKTGILYRDSIVGDIANQMRNTLYQSVEMKDGSSLGLYQIGITTGDWKENGKLVIEEEKLRAAIEENGDKVAELFAKRGSGIGDKLEKIVKDAADANGTLAKKAGIEGSYTEFNNELYRQLKSQNDKINNLLVKLQNKETYYYNMFAKLESAMSQSDSQMSYITSVFNSN